ncbi:hypothetical protein GCM10010211_49920 [Streptomyces albospinus]|uniref:Uncharacterized protein n=1 Tax=Streptomyces albospinus TaxID=285515 RepID=A0ABQ2VCX8_9ACTN|nr:hypothetical protein GCM10010211_49920 [Streptomyces albospinus]
MRPIIHGYAAVAAALCVGGFLVGGGALVSALVVAGVGLLTWQVAAASRPRPRWRGRPVGGPAGGSGVPAVRGRAASGVRIRHERDADVVHDEGRQGEGVEDLMEAEPPR